MQQFTDTKGRKWVVRITVTSALRLKQETGIDLLDDPGALEKVASSGAVFFTVLYALCKPDAEALKVTEADFGDAFDGDTIDAAVVALQEAYVDFSRPARRPAFRKLLDKTREVETRAADLVGKKLDALDVEELLAKAFGGSATNSGDTATSTPAPSPSPNS
jgi:hypothetical protein